MSLLVVGSIAYDSVRTPRGEVNDALGGSAVYFSLAASWFGPVRLVGAVGEDFSPAHIRFLESRGVDVSGLTVVEGGKTFRWTGEYSEDMNSRETLAVELNVLGDFRPEIPARFRDSRYVFLANGPPALQFGVLEQIEDPAFVMADTMDLWIRTERRALLDLLKRIDGLLLNDAEAELLTDRKNLLHAGTAILELGPSRVIIKKGEHGATLFTRDGIVPLPAYPTTELEDPTGAGDSFAGALMGYLAREDDTGEEVFRKAMAYGTIAASFTVEGFGTQKLAAVSRERVAERFERYARFLRI